MKPIKISELRIHLKADDIIFLKNFKKLSFRHAYKAICFLNEGKDKGKLLIARYKNCAQKILDPDTTVFQATIEDIG